MLLVVSMVSTGTCGSKDGPYGLKHIGSCFNGRMNNNASATCVSTQRYSGYSARSLSIPINGCMNNTAIACNVLFAKHRSSEILLPLEYWQ